VAVDDRWHIGSNLKAVVGMLAGIAVDQGKVAWTTTVEQVFPELAARVRPEYRGLTLTEMLSHSAGFPRDPLGLPLSGTPTVKRDSVVAWAVAQPPAAARGSYFYSNTDYIVAGAMLERALGMPFEQALTERVFTPLGITTAGFGPQAASGSTTQPVAHRMRPDGTWQEVEALDNPDVYASAGGVHMPLEAWARIVREVLRADAGRSALLSGATGRVVTTPVVRINATDGYAIGWITTSRGWGNGRVLTHNGSNTGNFSVAWLAPERGFAILVTTNAFDATAPTGRAARSTDALAARLIGLLVAPPAAP
jgi:CubicO group peptidase (beta-lactamase class C family)